MKIRATYRVQPSRPGWLPIILLPLFMGLLVTSGCSTFQRDWRAAMREPTAVPGLAGAWQGRWHSDANGHAGKLRCLVEKNSDGTFAAQFHAKFKTIFGFHYTAALQARREGEKYIFEGEADLGRLAGGIYSYQGEALGTNFFSRYSSKYDRGTFQMIRPSKTGQSGLQ